ncbi:lipid-binding protein [Ancylomarina longa]|uniref:Lipid-binding hydrolase n=1 Tax=Ancylomarina longa TaxID=2487017 RepID=A0A434AEY7_9BACT|nr:lipid-binding protein [Ancylomarina longa]RUT72908.1 hypothetical protein DLK05_16105 [Ancylomarina longa]
MKLKYIILLVFSMGLFASCDPNDTMDTPKTEFTGPGQFLQGEWFVTYTDANTGAVKATHSKISTFNTASNDKNMMWVDDDKNYWGLKSVVNCDPETNTFSGEDVDELYFGIKVNIKNGKVLPGAGTTAAGNVTDSIYMEIDYFDVKSDGTIQETNRIAAGVRRTGFLEDE